MRKLASIKRIDEVLPIEGADNLELIIIGGWQSIVQKKQFKAGELCIYCEVDSFLPIAPEYEFLRKSSFRIMWDKTEGFRIKTMRLRGVLSQGLVLPIQGTMTKAMGMGWVYKTSKNLLKNLDTDEQLVLEEGVDVTDLLHIVKWDTPPPGQWGGQAKGGIPENALGPFPSWIPRTDEERIQNCWQYLPKDVAYVETEKLHGTSSTYYIKDNVFGIASRNLELKPLEGGLYTAVAQSLGLEQKLRDFLKDRTVDGGFAIQGEIIGEGVNKNYYKVEGNPLFIFNVFDEAHGGYLPHITAMAVCKELGLNYVPVVNEDYHLPASCADALLQVQGPSTIGSQSIREGSVIRSHTDNRPRISAKIISNHYLEKEKD